MEEVKLDIKALLIDTLRRYKIFLIASLMLGMGDNITTHMAIRYGLGKYEGSPLHRFLGSDSLASWIIAFLGPAFALFGILLIDNRKTHKKTQRIIPHLIVVLQLLNVFGTTIVVRLAQLGKLII